MKILFIILLLLTATSAISLVVRYNQSHNLQAKADSVQSNYDSFQSKVKLSDKKIADLKKNIDTLQKKVALENIKADRLFMYLKKKDTTFINKWFSKFLSDGKVASIKIGYIPDGDTSNVGYELNNSVSMGVATDIATLVTLFGYDSSTITRLPWERNKSKSDNPKNKFAIFRKVDTIFIAVVNSNFTRNH